MNNAPLKTIQSAGNAEICEKRSRFIAAAVPVSSESEAKEFIALQKKKYHDAKHNCSAYILTDGTIRSSDDGEPAGTAGVPISETIRKSGLTGVCIVVTRYFGGVLLGAGGLVRAYTAAAAAAIAAAPGRTLTLTVYFRVRCSYGTVSSVLSAAAKYGASAEGGDYGETVTLPGKIKASEYDDFSDYLFNLTGGKIRPEKEKEIYE